MRIALLLLLCLAPFASAEPAKRVLIMTWDGSPKWLIDQLVADGSLPNLTKMMAEGAAAEYTTSNFPNCTTPPGHAALYTGCYSPTNGVVAYFQPKTPPDRYDITEQWSGFDSRNLRAEPLWVTLARAGKPSLLVHAPHVWPFDPFGEWKRFGLDCSAQVAVFSGYNGKQVARDVTYSSVAALKRAFGWKGVEGDLAGAKEFVFNAGGSSFHVLLYDDPKDPVAGLDTAVVAADKDLSQGKPVRVKPGDLGNLDRWSAPVPLSGENVAFLVRLIELDPAGKSFRLYRTSAYEFATNRPTTELADLLKSAGTFTGNGARRPYQAGEFGPTLMVGGDGSAEKMYLETVRVALRHQRASILWALERAKTGLVIGYAPVPDEAAHIWAGYLEPGGPAFDKDLDAKIRPYMRAILQELDGILGDIRKAAGPDTAVVISSDHGMRGYTHLVKPNIALKEAGLLASDLRGKIDLSKTKALFHPAATGFVCVNTTDRPGGIVKPEDRAAVAAEAKKVLAGLKDAEGKPLFDHVWDADPPQGELGLGRPETGELFLVPRRGLRWHGEHRGKLVEETAIGTGQHECLPDDLKTLMVFAGAGVAAGKNLGPVRHIDLAPTVLKLLGCEPGAKMKGKVLPVGP